MARLVQYHLPTTEPELLAAVGALAIRHEHLVDTLRMTIKTLDEATPSDPRRATRRVPAKELRKRIRRLAKEKLEGDDLVRLESLLQRAEAASCRRNEIVHSICVNDIDDERAQLYNDEHDLRPYPSVADLEELSAEVKRSRRCTAASA